MSFWEVVSAVLLLATALGVVRAQNAVHAALSLIANFLVVAAVYAGLEARFVAMTQVIVYAGAIVVLFLFVIMLLSAARSEAGPDPLPGLQPLALLGGVSLAAVLVYAVSRFQAPANPASLQGGLPQALGPLLYQPERWMYAVLLVGFLLLVATVAAMLLVEPERIAPLSSGKRPQDQQEGARP